MIVLEGQPALSQFRRARLESRLQSLSPSVRVRGAWHVYFVQPEAGAEVDAATLRRILQASADPVAAAADTRSRYIVPRLGIFQVPHSWKVALGSPNPTRTLPESAVCVRLDSMSPYRSKIRPLPSSG